MTVFVWSMIGIALWHFTIFVPDRFVGGIVGAFAAAWVGAIVSGVVLDGFAISGDNPPGMRHTLYAVPGAMLGLVGTYVAGARAERRSCQ